MRQAIVKLDSMQHARGRETLASLGQCNFFYKIFFSVICDRALKTPDVHLDFSVKGALLGTVSDAGDNHSFVKEQSRGTICVPFENVIRKNLPLDKVQEIESLP